MKVKSSACIAMLSSLFAINSFGGIPESREHGHVLFRHNVGTFNGIGRDISDNLSNVKFANITATELPSVNTIYIKDPANSQYVTKLICNDKLDGYTIYLNAGAKLYMVKSQEDINNGRSQDESGFWAGEYADNIVISTIGVGALFRNQIWNGIKTLAGKAATKMGPALKGANAYIVLGIVIYNLGDYGLDQLKEWFANETAHMSGELTPVEGAMKFACTYDGIGYSWKGDTQSNNGQTPVLEGGYTGSGSKYYLDVGTRKFYTDFVFAKTSDPKPFARSLCDTMHWPADDGTCLPRTSKCQIHPYIESERHFVRANGQETGAPIGYEEATLCPTWNGSEFEYPDSKYVRFYDDNAIPLLSSRNSDFAAQVKATEHLIEQPQCIFTCTSSGWEVTANGNAFCDATKGYAWNSNMEACVNCAAELCRDSGGRYSGGNCTCGGIECTGTHININYKYCAMQKIEGDDYICQEDQWVPVFDVEQNYKALERGWKANFDACLNPTSSVTMVNASSGMAAGESISTLAGRLAKVEDQFGLSKWRTAEGKFNTARLASDLTAGVVLGTTGALVTSSVVKKKQVKDGFESLECTVGGQHVGDWGDVFRIDGK